MSKNNKVNIFITFLIISLLCSSMLFLSACNLNIANEKSNEYFIYMVMANETEDGYITLRGLTDAGKELEYIVIPDEIEGYPVRVIHGGAIANNLKKIYISKNVKSIVNSSSWISGSTGYKTLYCRYDCTRSSIGNNMGNAYVPSIAEEKYKECIKNFDIANLTYFYNYENSINGGIHFIDDLDAGESIAVIPPEPIREGYRFAGWYLDEECTEIFDIESYIRNEENGIINLYAGWEAVSV